ncbi:MAG: hypothetical protein M5U26_04595 [Planctomycetota bacterium]|nr:hypothetical protein [Planctomycetota bacterium]
MGGLLARTWMDRHYLTRLCKPPVARLIECGSPRHGVWLRPFSRALIRLGCVPGRRLARAMLAPNPWLWDLAWKEAGHAELLPPVAALTGHWQRLNWMAPVLGGAPSDGVVPLASSNPNPLFLRPGHAAFRFPLRAFRVVPGFGHNRPRGLLSHLRDDSAADPVWRAVQALLDGEEPRVEGYAEERAAYFYVRSSSGAPTLRLGDGPEQRPRFHDGGCLNLFRISCGNPGLPQLRDGGRTWTLAELGLPEGPAPGGIHYVDLAG